MCVLGFDTFRICTSHYVGAELFFEVDMFACNLLFFRVCTWLIVATFAAVAIYSVGDAVDFNIANANGDPQILSQCGDSSLQIDTSQV